MRGEIPLPSSRMVEVGVRREVVKRGFLGLERKDAKSGVIFQSTDVPISLILRGKREILHEYLRYLPAPVVPPARFELNTPGD